MKDRERERGLLQYNKWKLTAKQGQLKRTSTGHHPSFLLTQMHFSVDVPLLWAYNSIITDNCTLNTCTATYMSRAQQGAGAFFFLKEDIMQNYMSKSDLLNMCL